MKPSEKFFVAVREDKSSGREFFDPDSFSNEARRSMDRARDKDERISTIAEKTPVKKIIEVAVAPKVVGEPDLFIVAIPWRAYWLLSENGFIASVREHAGTSKGEQEAERAFALAKFGKKGEHVTLSATLAGLGVLRSWFASILDDTPDDVSAAFAAVEIRAVEKEASK